MLGMGPMELIIILLIVIVLFGSSRLPQLGKGLGEGISNFKRGLKDKDQLEDGDDQSDDDAKN